MSIIGGIRRKCMYPITWNTVYVYWIVIPEVGIYSDETIKKNDPDFTFYVYWPGCLGSHITYVNYG